VASSTTRPGTARLTTRGAQTQSSLTICGSGNAAHALAVVASQNLDVDIDWLVGSHDKAARLRRGVSAAGLHSTGAITAAADRVRTISADPEQVIPNADLILIVVPAYAHASILGRIKPCVSSTTAIGCMPTRGGFELEATQLGSGDRSAGPDIFGLQTLPWSTRITTFGEVVNIGAVKGEVVLAALPPTDASSIAARLTQILGTQIVATESFLSLTLGNPGQFIHSGLMYGHFRGWQGEEFDENRIPMLYAEATDEMGEIVERLSNEAIAVARQIETQSNHVVNLQSAVLPIHEWLIRVYGDVTRDVSSVASCFRTGPIQARKAPMVEVRPGKFAPDFEYRYLREDVPYGLVATRALAEIAQVDTPAIDEVVTWAQSALGKVYLVDQRLQGRDACELRIPQNYGLSTLADLIDWYSGNTSVDVSRDPGGPTPSR
jgi:hypothetical protein